MWSRYALDDVLNVLVHVSYMCNGQMDGQTDRQMCDV